MSAGVGGFRVGGRTVMIIIVLAIVAGIFFTVASVYLNAAPTTTVSMTGKLYVDGSGQLNGTSQYVATYNVTLDSMNGNGTLGLKLLSTSGDPLTVHNYTVTSVVADPYHLNLTLDGNPVSLTWISNTTVWKQYNESYIGSWGPSVPADELVGSISTQDFPGLSGGYYIFLSLTVPSQPADNIPFAIRSLG